MTVTNHTLASYLHTYLQCDTYKDYAPNGMQVEGKKTIQLLCTAVTASQAVIEEAVNLQADALLVHHGYFWKGEDENITGMKKNRLQRLLQHDMNLFAYHLPLDGHVDVGNNACLAERLELGDITIHPAGNHPNLLWTGKLTQVLSPEALIGHLQQKLHREPLWIAAPSREIQKLAWCTGAAQDFIVYAAQLGVDAFISGEVSERTYYQAKELGIHYYGCGHHATERYGVQALGHYLSHQFHIEHRFIDSDNPI